MTTDGTRQLVTWLFNRRELIKRRNKIVDRPFFLWRPRLKRIVGEIDARLDVIDENIRHQRSILLGKKPVRVQDTQMRFYVSDGWSLDSLSPYIQGDIQIHQERDDRYYTIAPNAEVSVDVLYASEVLSSPGMSKDFFRTKFGESEFVFKKT